MNVEKKTIAAWLVSPKEFPHWLEHCGDGAMTAAEYLHRLEVQEAAAQSLGYEIDWIEMPVATMLEKLSAAGLENTPPNRAAIAVTAASKEPAGKMVLGLTLRAAAVGWALVFEANTVEPGHQIHFGKGDQEITRATIAAIRAAEAAS